MTRLIDADALKERITKIVHKEQSVDLKWAVGLNSAIQLIDDAPTVEPKQVLPK